MKSKLKSVKSSLSKIIADSERGEERQPVFGEEIRR